MTSEDDKALYTLQTLLHGQVMALGEMLLERLAQQTGESVSELHATWRERSRRMFLDTLQQTLKHPSVTSSVPVATMLANAEEMWKQEDEMLQASQSGTTES